MNPFNPKAKCPKCGNAEISTCFHAEKERRPLGVLESGGYYLCDTLVRRCERCKYEWYEAPLDAKKGDGK